MMKAEPICWMVTEKPKVMKQGAVGGTGEELIPLACISPERLHADRGRALHVHLATVRQWALTSPWLPNAHALTGVFDRIAESDRCLELRRVAVGAASQFAGEGGGTPVPRACREAFIAGPPSSELAGTEAEHAEIARKRRRGDRTFRCGKRAAEQLVVQTRRSRSPIGDFRRRKS
jgi:hypothetical protein